jgi:nucleotide-binding universal stress UspA family protein
VTLDTNVGWDGSGGGPFAIVRVLNGHADPATEDRARFELNVEASRARGLAPGLDITSDLRRGDPARVLAAATGPGRLLVVGTQHRLQSGPRFRCSLVLRLAGRVAGPVAVVPNEPIGDRGRVVVGFDGSEPSYRALEIAAEEAGLAGKPLRIVQARPLRPGRGFPLKTSDCRSGPTRSSLNAARSHVADRYPELRVETVSGAGEPVAFLRQEARAARVLVLGTRGRKQVLSALFGSVSRSTLLDIRVPTIVVGSERHRPALIPTAAVAGGSPIDGEVVADVGDAGGLLRAAPFRRRVHGPGQGRGTPVDGDA